MGRPKVVNIRNVTKGKYKLVDRRTPYGNPFKIGPDGDRYTVLAKFRSWIMKPEQRELRKQAKKELKGKDLGCWCKPKSCHAEVWLELVNVGV